MKKKAKIENDSPYKKLTHAMLDVIALKPGKAKVTEEIDNGNTNISLEVAKEDMGRVIGKGGKVIKAIRNMLRIRAIKEGKHVNVTLLE